MEAFALSVFFAFLLAWAYSNGGVIYADMTAFGEQHAEYWLMWVFVPVITLATFYALESLPSAAQLE